MNSSEIYFRIIRRRGKLLSNLRIGILHIRHINIHKSFEQLERLNRIIPAGIINCGQCQAALPCQFNSSRNSWNNVRRSNEINIAAAVILQAEHRLSQLLDRNFPAVAMMAYIEVLTKNTAQVTAGKKYSARPPTADENAFLAVMRPHRADHRHLPDSAKAGFALAAIDLALTRT